MDGWLEALDATDRIMLAEGYVTHKHLLPASDRMSDRIRRRIERGAHVTADEVATARGRGRAFRARLDGLLRRYAALALPTMVGIPPRLDERAGSLAVLTEPVNLAGLPALALPVPRPGALPASLAGQTERVSTELMTFGHGTAGPDDIVELLRGAAVEAVVDIRTAPGSRRNPHVARKELEAWLPERGPSYRWEKRLGGFRKLDPDSPDVIWRNDAFRAYAGYTREPAFVEAIDELLRRAAERLTAVMCSESVWWRCHRRIVADFVRLARDTPVRHLMHDGRLVPHPVTEGARLRDDGLLVYDGGQRALGGG
ncbi:MAG: DUF488 family protein [Streptosporangiaceae bacterium]